MRWISLLCVLTLCAPAITAAQSAPTSAPLPAAAGGAPTEAPDAVPPAGTTVAGAAPDVLGVSAPSDEAARSAWAADFDHARRKLLAGDFAEAAAAFAALEPTAPTPTDAAIARALGAAAADWAGRRLALVPRAAVGDTGLADRAANRRTTSELAELYIAAVLYGVVLTGGFVALLVEPDSPSAAIIPALAFGGAAAGGVYLVDRAELLGYGVPQTMVVGLSLGLQEGVLWTAWNQSAVDSVDEWSAKTMGAVVWTSGTLGLVAGGVLGNMRGNTPGRAAYVGSAGTWTAAVAGFGTGAFTADSHEGDEIAVLAAAIGLNAGAIAGALTAEPVSPSKARVRFLDLGGISGLLVGGGLYLSIADDDSSARGLMAAAATGTAAGLAGAWFLTDDMEPDRLEDPPASVSLAPTPDGAALVVSGSF